MTLSELKSWAQCACSDLTESEADGDRMYDNVLAMRDLIGTRIYGEPNRDDLLCAMLDEEGIFPLVAECIINVL